jgi:hypothetical protein
METSPHDHVLAAVSEGDDQIHKNENQVVMPAGALVAPESDVPGEDLFPDGAEHDEDQTAGGELSENPERHTQTSGKFRGAEKNRKWLRHANALGACRGIFEVAVAAGNEDEADHQPQQQDSEIGETSELGEHAAFRDEDFVKLAEACGG